MRERFPTDLPDQQFSPCRFDYHQLYRHVGKWNWFFRWIKQHLRIKAFYGTSENAVKTQAWWPYRLRARGDCQKATGARPEPVQNSADSQCHSFRKTPILEAFSNFSDEIKMPNLHPVESIRLLMGQHWCEWWAWVDLNHRPRPYQGFGERLSDEACFRALFEVRNWLQRS